MADGYERLHTSIGAARVRIKQNDDRIFQGCGDEKQGSLVNVLVISNPRSGQGDSRRFEFIGELCRRGCDVVVRQIDHGRSIEVALRDASAFDVVVTAGGDGTVSAAAYALRGTSVPIFPYPAGTANAVALNLGIIPDAARCADAVMHRRLVRVDLGEITCPRAGDAAPITQGFVAIAGAGLDAALMERGAALKPQFGANAYLLAALENASPTFAHIELELDGKRVRTEGSCVLLVNFGRMQFDLTLTHDSDAQDGMIEVVVIKARHVVDLLPAVLASYLDRIVTYPSRSQIIDAYRAHTVSLRCTPDLPVQSDGEVVPATTPLTCRVLPRAATFVAQPGASLPGVSVDVEP